MKNLYNSMIGKLVVGTIIVLLLSVMFFSIRANAATKYKSKSTKWNIAFAVPNGGWSASRGKLTYKEYYYIKNGKSVFTRRERDIYAKNIGATEKPACRFTLVKHSNGKVFSKWKNMSTISQKGYQSELQYNSTDETYARNTKITATAKILVTCNGAIVPSRPQSVSFRLNTK